MNISRMKWTEIEDIMVEWESAGNTWFIRDLHLALEPTGNFNYSTYIC